MSLRLFHLSAAHSASHNSTKKTTTKNKIDIKNLVIGAWLGAVIVFSVAAATSSTGHVPFEYKVVSGDVFQDQLDKAINSTIADGWQFVSASHMTEHWAFAVLRREKK